jgi:RecA-family ATPase
MVAKMMTTPKDSVPPQRRRLEPLALVDLLALDLPDARWAIDGLAPFGGIPLLTGEPGTFKTWLLLELALCVAEGRPFLGQFTTTACPVLYVDEENGEGLLQDRLMKLGAGEGVPVYFTCFDGFKLKQPDVGDVLRQCERLGVKLVIIDSLVRVHNARY